MVYKKKRVVKKRMPMQRRKMRKPAATARQLNLKSDIHYFSRYIPAMDISTLSTITSSIGAILLNRLNDVNNFSEYQAMFEQYRIIGVQYTFRLMDNPDSSSYLNQPLLPQGANFYPMLWWVVDRDDASVPTLLQIRERGAAKCRVLRPNADIKIFVKYPNVLQESISTGATVPAQQTAPVWLNTGDANVPHFGLKVVLDKMGYAGNTFTVGIDRKYYFAFKQSK